MKQCLFYLGAILAALVAIGAGVVFHLSQIPNNIVISLDDQTERWFQPAMLTPEQVTTYERDGVVFVPSLLSEEESDRLKHASEYAMSRVFPISKLFGTALYSELAYDIWRTSPDAASFALQALPKTVVSLLPYSKNENDEVEFRLLRDAFFTYEAGGAGCGWHVDDLGFWPTMEDRDGPTIWIALDEIKVAEGGGLALLNRTRFRQLIDPMSNITEENCLKVIRTEGTCGMESSSPECHKKMEDSKMEWDLKPGDAIIWNRWTFHRGVAATTNNDIADKEAFVKKRYSVRYMPHGSKAGPLIHPSVGSGNEFDSPYYPQVWPKLKESELKAMEHGLEADAKLSRILPYAIKLLCKRFLQAMKFNA